MNYSLYVERPVSVDWIRFACPITTLFEGSHCLTSWKSRVLLFDIWVALNADVPMCVELVNSGEGRSQSQ